MKSWERDLSRCLQRKIEDCGEDLWHWGSRLVSDFRGIIYAHRSRICNLRGRRYSIGLQEFHEAVASYGELLKQQDIYWKQRAKKFWLKDGDSNSKFFHAFASRRKKKNKIERLKGDDRKWYDWENGLGNLMIGYFHSLFSSQQGATSSITGLVHQQVSSEQNSELMKPIEELEVKEVLFDIHPDKSPGLNGMNAAFF